MVLDFSSWTLVVENINGNSELARYRNVPPEMFPEQRDHMQINGNKHTVKSRVYDCSQCQLKVRVEKVRQ